MIRRNNTNRKSPSFPKSPLESAHKPTNRKNRLGQNVTEYLILVAGVLVVVILAANSKGIFTQGANRAIGIMMNSVETVATEQCLMSADDVPGAWGSWSSWTPCVSCSQTRTRACDSPAPRCNGAACLLGDGTRGLIETVSQACTGSGTWVAGSCGACTGTCGSATGTCPVTVSCSGGCCDPMLEPPSIRACTKTPYPDVWVEVNDWVCSVLCGTGTETQTVTCSGSCCDPATKPPSTRSCTITCDDGDFCNGTEICNSSTGCQPGTPLVCDDGMFCNGVETCSSALGSCQPGTPPAVDDGIPCTTDSCDEVSNIVVHTPNNASCDNSLFCDGAEYCNVSSGCQAGSALVLSDGVSCTVDSCDEVSNIVVHTPNNNLCSDNNVCTGTETCNAVSGCQAGTPLVCDDNLFCNGTETCNAVSGCQAGSAPVLSDGIPCTTDSCDEVSNIVVHAPNNASCDDGLFCNGAEYCNVSSGCQAGSAPVLSDGVSCTVDSCDEVSNIVVHTPNNNLCSDNNVCTGTETCNAVSGCQAGTPLVCSNDNLFCTGTEGCNTSSGCVSSGNPCSAPAVCQEALDSCCGNGVRDGFEQCDWNGPDLGGQSCFTQGWGNGQLACSGTCQFNRSLCERQLCANGGGSWNSTCQCCQFFLSSCPASWYQHQNWSRTTSRYCADPTSPSQCQYTGIVWGTGGACSAQFGPNACITGGHAFSNNWTIETCTIWARNHWYDSGDNLCHTWCANDDYVYGTCSATRSGVGCRYYL